MATEKSQWQLSIGNNWILKREYHFVVLSKKEKQATSQTEDQRLLLIPEQGIYLNETEWIGLVKPENAGDIKATDSWSLFSHDIWIPADVQLYVEKRKAGDRIKLTENLTKKYLDILSIRKYLIHKGSMLGSLQMPKEIYIA